MRRKPALNPMKRAVEEIKVQFLTVSPPNSKGAIANRKCPDAPKREISASRVSSVELLPRPVVNFAERAGAWLIQ
jgi:hypothetical protein